MKILVSVASKHGSTAEIGAAIGRELEAQGYEVDLTTPDQVTDATGYGAAVLGSAVYAGHWRPEALDMVVRTGATLRTMPVWLFSSGPLGSPPKPDEDPVDVATLSDSLRAADHRLFAGKLDRGSLGLGERAIVTALRAPYGDFRDWEAITVWAKEIAASLEEPEVR